MKTMHLVSSLAFCLLAIISKGYCATVYIELSEQFIEEKGFSVEVLVLNHKNQKLEEISIYEYGIIEIADSIGSHFTIILRPIIHYPIIISRFEIPPNDTLKITDANFIYSRRRSLPKGASCGNFAPDKKDIPRKISLRINGKKRYFHTDKKGVRCSKYIQKPD
jgi:hypothetical protein